MYTKAWDFLIIKYCITSKGIFVPYSKQCSSDTGVAACRCLILSCEMNYRKNPLRCSAKCRSMSIDILINGSPLQTALRRCKTTDINITGVTPVCGLFNYFDNKITKWVIFDNFTLLVPRLIEQKIQQLWIQFIFLWVYAIYRTYIYIYFQRC